MKKSKSKRGRPPKPEGVKNITKTYSWKHKYAAFLSTLEYPVLHLSKLLDADPKFQKFLKKNY